MAVSPKGVDASAVDSCVSTEVVAVRGSGQIYGESPELRELKSLLPENYLFTELENKISSLSMEPAYKAIAVKGDLQDDVAGVGAVIVSRLGHGKYKESVNSGKNLLKKYIAQKQSTDTCIVLVGYSQGAQVINETVHDMHTADPSSLRNIIYIGLLGDPLYNPYGFDTSRKPSWLRGNALHPFWGVLFNGTTAPGAERPDYIPRNPVNPNATFTKVGSWCNYGDVICATNLTHYAAMRDGHGSYIEESIPEVVNEIRAAVANPDQNITGALWPSSTCGAAKQDLVVLLDTSDYMRRNRDLFTKDKNTWDTKVSPITKIKMHRTFGEQLLDSGCGDKRVAVVGFDAKQAPRLLVSFTNQASEIDNLMESLYQPSNGGIAERPHLREAAILAMQQSWRPDASRTLFALSPLAGSGTINASWRESWDSDGVRNRYMSDPVGQQFLALSRQTRAALISAVHLPIDMSGFSMPAGYPGANDPFGYMQSLARLTGGYNWEKTFVLYPFRHIVKNVNFSEEILQFEKRRDATKVTMGSIRAKVGQPITLELNDSADLLASAAQRAGHGTGASWYLDCDSLQTMTDFPVVKKTGLTTTFTPTKPGSCTAAVRIYTQGAGNGCYWGCPEPFPPYMLRVIPFKLEVKPADYEEKVPSNITSMTKKIFDDRVEFSWQPPSYNDTDVLVYLIKDFDGSVLAATTENSAVITDTEKQDVNVAVQAIGADGRSEDYSSTDVSVQVTDSRSVETQAPENPSENEPNSNTTEKNEKTLGIGSPGQLAVASVEGDSSLTSARTYTEELQVSTSALAAGQTLGQSAAEMAAFPAQIDVIKNDFDTWSSKWWWLLLVIVIGVTGLLVGESRARKQ